MEQAEGPISERVIQKVAAATNTSTLELPPLYDDVDPDALDSLINEMSGGEVIFMYNGHKVSVQSNGDIHLDDGSQRSSATRYAESDD
ncbi:HalOD1 output domain-containing protein [Halovenus marina]|uniref:HalOD1 output domain-containing protein n=1 Tax=Halovenus marina TaxID=3396621 RepID=UPI003F58025E